MTRQPLAIWSDENVVFLEPVMWSSSEQLTYLQFLTYIHAICGCEKTKKFTCSQEMFWKNRKNCWNDNRGFSSASEKTFFFRRQWNRERTCVQRSKMGGFYAIRNDAWGTLLSIIIMPCIHKGIFGKKKKENSPPNSLSFPFIDVFGSKQATGHKTIHT